MAGRILVGHASKVVTGCERLLVGAASNFPKLLEPFVVGNVALRNRLVMAPMGTRFPDDNGFVTERQIAYYEERARGGVGLVIVEATEVDPEGLSTSSHPRIYDDKFVSGLSELARRIHLGGGPVFLQLLHSGRLANSRVTEVVPVAPSAIAAAGKDKPRALSETEIGEIVGRFALAAKRAKEAGFDGVEVHAAHGYLINQFLSYASNQRQDAYGGDLAGRARLALEIAHATRAAVGQDYALCFRLNGQEFGVADGLNDHDCAAVAGWLADAGIDAIHVSAFGVGHPDILGSVTRIPGMLTPLAATVKQAVRVPVIAVGRITPEVGERILREGKADLIAMGRALLADPELPNKLVAGRRDEITPCIGCLQCRDAVGADQALKCSVNPAMGHERERAIGPAARQRRVLVAGGGPAGLEAARVAAQRGHEVTLFEKTARLGGQLLAGSVPPEKGELAALAAAMAKQAEAAGVRLAVGEEAGPDKIAAWKPDTVVLAAGSKAIVPQIEGLAERDAVLAIDVLSGKADTGRRVVVIGGGLVGCETADYLADCGKRVTIVRRGPAMADDMTPSARAALLRRLSAKQVELLCGVQYREATPRGLVICDAEQQEKLLEADTLVIAAGAMADTRLADGLRNTGIELHVVGDCVKPRGIAEAIAEGRDAGRML